jgi:hypothetical protein
MQQQHRAQSVDVARTTRCAIDAFKQLWRERQIALSIGKCGREPSRAKSIDTALSQLRIVKAQRVNGQLRIIGFNGGGGIAGIDGQCGG